MDNIFKIPKLALFFSLLLLVFSGVFSICLGAANIPVFTTFEFIFQMLLGDWESSNLTDIQKTIILEWRLPRFFLGALVGASLSVAGSGFQGVFRNPLADPFLFAQRKC